MFIIYFICLHVYIFIIIISSSSSSSSHITSSKSWTNFLLCSLILGGLGYVTELITE